MKKKSMSALVAFVGYNPTKEISMVYKKSMFSLLGVAVFALPLVVAAIVLALTGCGNAGERDIVRNYYEVGNCTVVETEEGGAQITCPDGTEVVVASGEDGLNGVDGKDGVDGTDGMDGEDGKDGKNATAKAPIYLGYYCGRTVLKIAGKVYVIYSGLTQLTVDWFRVSNSCELRYINKKIEQR